MLEAKQEKLKGLLQEQRRYLNYFFDHLKFEEVQKIIDIALQCEGLIILTGIGKSGIIAEKIAMTLVSTGTRALYIPAQNFLHGDIGVVSKKDLVIVLSKSGETRELIDLVPHVRNKECRIASVVSDDESTLARISDLSVCLPVEKELCPFDLAPTTSTAVQLLFGDLLAMALMSEKGFSLEEYATNHPSGAIGKKITQTVRDLMQVSLPLCKQSDRLVDCLVELSNKKCGCLIVADDEMQLLGIFTDGDLRRALQKEGAPALQQAIETLMNKAPVSVEPNLLAHAALELMQSGRYVTVLPVLENKKVVGLIRMHDIIHQGI